MKKSIRIAMLMVLIYGCQTSDKNPPITPQAHLAEVETWYQSRVENLKGADGWLNLIGLYWLKEGSNDFGRGEENELVVPVEGFPLEIGNFILQEEQVLFIPKIEGIKFSENKVTGELLIFENESSESKELSFEGFRWSVIKRAEAYGVRLRDLETLALTGFKDIDRYPVDLKWRLEANFIPYDPIKEIPITNVLGQTTPNPSPGVVEFEIEGKSFRLDALDGGEKELFLIFADGTSGGETYGGGRYIYIPKADQDGRTVLDFNKAYNPPCVFTAHATCPLPPRQNILDLDIRAGEKDFHH